MARNNPRVAQDQKPFVKRLLSLSDRHNRWEIWSDFITMLAIAISNSVDTVNREEREKVYMRTIKKYRPEEQQVFPELVADVVQALEEHPFQDFLGSMYMELDLGNDSTGQFFTPYDVCKMMARLSDDMAQQILDKGYITVNDCACGAGATLIAACEEADERLRPLGLNWQNCVLVFAQDLDYSAAMMCYIQLTFIGAAAVIKVGNTLTSPMATGDDLKDYWFTPVYFTPIWKYRRIFHSIDQLFKEEKEA